MLKSYKRKCREANCYTRMAGYGITNPQLFKFSSKGKTTMNLKVQWMDKNQSEVRFTILHSIVTESAKDWQRQSQRGDTRTTNPCERAKSFWPSISRRLRRTRRLRGAATSTTANDSTNVQGTSPRGGIRRGSAARPGSSSSSYPNRGVATWKQGVCQRSDFPKRRMPGLFFTD